MKEEIKACFVSNTHKAGFELRFHASIVTVGSWKFPGMTQSENWDNAFFPSP
ncbi:MAG: hypothetical protein GY749_23185 [Desulfobacteraceae bacterium]|nr:hypothetical protein [Desulfobacteraceae bacterium]